MKQHTSIEVRLTIFECDPDKVTRLLGIVPTRTWQQGDPVSWSTKVACKVSGWQFKSPLPTTKPPEDHIEALLKAIRPAIHRFKRLPSNARIDLLCAVHAYDDSQRVFEISTEAIKILAKIGATIDFEYYDYRVKDSD